MTHDGDVVVRAAGLSKQYRLGVRKPYSTLRESIAHLWSGRRLPNHRAEKRPLADRFWALRDVSFEVSRGDIVGIVGPNGAGKSTLLKVLSRITEPSEGYVDVLGRVGSLLEVGTGFHPELTGRENIFLNGAILGMRRAEIESSLEEIVAFSEVSQFVDTPVKFYSSGMYLRLAFSVAAHLSPEILIVDEVLAVGDAQFQRKCLQKMLEVSRSGRTVIFVSHNLSAVRNICTRGLAIDHGRIVDDGPVDAVIDRYLARVSSASGEEAAASTSMFDVEGVDVSSRGGPVIKTFDEVVLSVRLRARRPIRDPGLYFGILTFDHQRVAGLDYKDFATCASLSEGDQVEIAFDIKSLPLMPGTYHLELHVKDMSEHKIEIVPRLFSFDVVDSVVYGGRKLDQWFGVMGLRADARAVTHTSLPVTTARGGLRAGQIAAVDV